VDGTDQRYRLHHLFRDFLRARLKSLGEARFLGACERAAAVLEEGGDRNAALEIAMIGGDAQLAAAIVVRAVETSFDMSNEGDSHVAIRSWLRQYGNEAVYSDPETMLQLLLVLAMSGGQDVTGWLTEVERALPDADAFLRSLLHGVWPSRTWPKDPLITLCPTTRWLSSGPRRRPGGTRSLKRFQRSWSISP